MEKKQNTEIHMGRFLIIICKNDKFNKNKEIFHRILNSFIQLGSSLLPEIKFFLQMELTHESSLHHKIGF